MSRPLMEISDVGLPSANSVNHTYSLADLLFRLLSAVLTSFADKGRNLFYADSLG